MAGEAAERPQPRPRPLLGGDPRDGSGSHAVSGLVPCRRWGRALNLAVPGGFSAPLRRDRPPAASRGAPGAAGQPPSRLLSVGAGRRASLYPENWSASFTPSSFANGLLLNYVSQRSAGLGASLHFLNF